LGDIEMKISIAKSSGFCMGVRRAVEMVLEASTKHEKLIFTYGPLIHNPQVLHLLEDKGVQILDDTPDTGAGMVLIRAHGVPPKIKEKLVTAGFDILDATCPRVIKIQNIIKKYAEQGYVPIILGDKNHPEVIGLQGYAKETGHVVGSLDDFDDLPGFEKAIIVAQSTQNTKLFQSIKEYADCKYPHYKIFDTICGSTERRQAEVKRLADTVDAILVVGGRNSGNTQRLVDISRQAGRPTFHIETEADLNSIDQDQLNSFSIIGITAGASTPNWIIKKVYKALEELPYRGKHGRRGFLFGIQRSLLLTNIYLSLGAGLFCYACVELQGLGNHMPYILLSILYVQSMHILNHLTGGKADEYNEPDRASFYRKNMHLLTLLAIFSGTGGLAIAFMMDAGPFSIVLAMSVMGLSYNLKLLPENFIGVSFRRMKDIPGSKTILIALAWAILVAIIPPLATFGTIYWSNWLIFFWAAGLVFVRTSFFDILDMQGDRLVGKETIALLLGEKRSLRLLNIILGILILVLPLASALQLISPLGFVLTLCPIFIRMILSGYKNGYLLPGIRLEFLVETVFILAGLITFIWVSVA
jgi:(E)-4-hydroxy-3-methyl-but-2-enyl pyrophosphate reductase